MNVTIEIADADEPRLREMAQRCGYDNVEKFVSDDLAPMSEEELQASLATIEESMRVPSLVTTSPTTRSTMPTGS